MFLNANLTWPGPNSSNIFDLYTNQPETKPNYIIVHTAYRIWNNERQKSPFVICVKNSLLFYYFNNFHFYHKFNNFSSDNFILIFFYKIAYFSFCRSV